MKAHFSSLDEYNTLVICVEHGDTGPVVDTLETRGHGYAVFGESVEIPFAVVDYRLLEQPDFSEDHMLAIEAHELGHIKTNSAGEYTAEMEGIRLLQSGGHEKAANLLLSRGIVEVS